MSHRRVGPSSSSGDEVPPPGLTLADATEEKDGSVWNFAFGANTVTAQLQLNGALTPGFPATIPEWYAISKNSVDVDYGKEPECYTLDQYRTNFSVICHRMCLPGSSVRSLSGQDTRGIYAATQKKKTGKRRLPPEKERQAPRPKKHDRAATPSA